MIYAGIGLSAVCFLAKGLVLKVALLLYPSYENTIYLDGGISYAGIARGLLVLALHMWYCRNYPKEKEDKELRFYAQLNLLSIVVSAFFSFLPVVTRIAYYFSVSQLLMIPRIIYGITDEKQKKRMKQIIVIACVIYFVAFLATAHQPGVGLLPYRSWLFESEVE